MPAGGQLAVDQPRDRAAGEVVDHEGDGRGAIQHELRTVQIAAARARSIATCQSGKWRRERDEDDTTSDTVHRT